MSDTATQTASEQPAQVAQKSSENKTNSNGAANTSQSDFARRIAAAQVAPSAFAPKTTEATNVQPKAEPAKADVSAKEAPADTKTEEADKAPTATETEDGAETEAKAETADATETESEEVLSPENHSLGPRLKAKIDRRIGKEVAKRKELERKVASLEALVAQPAQAEEKEVVIHAPANVPLAEITNQTQLEQLRAQARAEVRWAEQWLDEDIPAEGIQTDRGPATKRQLKEIRRNASTVLEDLIPQRESFLKSRQTATQTAHEKFPFLKDPTHPGYQMAQAARRDPNNAWLHGLPNADYVLGVQIKGLLALQAEEAAKSGQAAKVAPKPKPRPTPGQSEIASDASPSRAPTGMMDKVALDNERARIAGTKKSLGHKDFASLLVANQRYRNSQ